MPPEFTLCISEPGHRTPVWPSSLLPSVHPGCPVLSVGAVGSRAATEHTLVLAGTIKGNAEGSDEVC